MFSLRFLPQHLHYGISELAVKCHYYSITYYGYHDQKLLKLCENANVNCHPRRGSPGFCENVDQIHVHHDLEVDDHQNLNERVGGSEQCDLPTFHQQIELILAQTFSFLQGHLIVNCCVFVVGDQLIIICSMETLELNNVPNDQSD